MEALQDDIWAQKYRPQKIDDIILPERIKRPFKNLVEKKEIPNLLLSGHHGTGKTTIARAFANELGADVLFINSSDERSIDTLRSKVKPFASNVSLTKGLSKIVIFDEADNMPATFQLALRSFIETFSKNCRFIFTCNYPHRIIKEIRSRLQHVDFSWEKDEIKPLMKEFGKRSFDILKKEGIEIDGKAGKIAIAQFIKLVFPDMRKVLNELQFYSNIYQKIDEGLLVIMDESKLEELFISLKKKSYQELREFAKNTRNKDDNLFFRAVFDNLEKILDPDSIPDAILLIKNYIVESPSAFDKEIHIMGFLIELASQCKFK